MSWTTNPIMEWSENGGTTWTRISDHGRTPLSITTERIENKQRMADGTLRRYVVAKKKIFSCAWDMMPSKAVQLLTNGQPGEWMQDFHSRVDGAFLMRLRAGSDINQETIPEEQVFTVMISDFSHEVIKRGPSFDFWNLDITLEEV